MHFKKVYKYNIKTIDIYSKMKYNCYNKNVMAVLPFKNQKKGEMQNETQKINCGANGRGNDGCACSALLCYVNG